MYVNPKDWDSGHMTIKSVVQDTLVFIYRFSFDKKGT